MEVILLEKVRNLGALGDKVKVKSGFARNFLVPQGKAVYANEANLAKFEKRRAELEKAAADRHEKALARQQKLQSLAAVVITMKAGEEGKLFGSVGVRDITEALNRAGAEVQKREVRLNEGSLRMVGDYDITIDLDSDIAATVKLKIVGEG
ncbi:MAG TPA: 50S ribosomal protein L9 [Gammaproteobacteria bacterium]|nr:50S ribosomal protein L9 [Gammaproteobacteria bacterium]